MGKCKRAWMSLPKPCRYISYAILGVLGIVLIGFIFGLLIMILWNWLMPEIFGLGEITYWQGFGLYILGRLLFGSHLNNKEKTIVHEKSKVDNYKEEKIISVE